MSQALIEFFALSISIAVLLAALIENRKTRKALEYARDTNVFLLEHSAELAFKLAVKEAANKDLKREVNAAKAQVAILTEFPLFYADADKLPQIVHDELVQRAANSIDLEDARKLASKVGGKAFRVVDAIKRGKL